MASALQPFDIFNPWTLFAFNLLVASLYCQSSKVILPMNVFKVPTENQWNATLNLKWACHRGLSFNWHGRLCFAASQGHWCWPRHAKTSLKGCVGAFCLAIWVYGNANHEEMSVCCVVISPHHLATRRASFQVSVKAIKTEKKKKYIFLWNTHTWGQSV